MKTFIHFLARFVFSIISRIDVKGISNIPQDGPVILTGNHIGILDGVMLPSVPFIARHPNLIVVVAEKYEGSPFFRWAVKHLEFMFIDRFKPDVSTLKKVISRLKDDGLLVISPEGTRSPNAQLLEAKSGTAYLAAKTGAQVVPFGVTGTEDSKLKDHLRRLKRLKVSITIGEPYRIPPLPGSDRDSFLQKYTDEIMCQIGALLPPSYRGVYSDHPRLQELLQNTA
jgi:1-acyl-sn-glycerol-3-phosphate acyltransferase